MRAVGSWSPSLLQPSWPGADGPGANMRIWAWAWAGGGLGYWCSSGLDVSEQFIN